MRQQLRRNVVASLSQYLETSWFLGGEVCLRSPPPVQEAFQFCQTLFVRRDAPPQDQSCSGIAPTQIFVGSSASPQGLVFTEYRKKGIDYENF